MPLCLFLFFARASYGVSHAAGNDRTSNGAALAGDGAGEGSIARVEGEA